MDEKVEFKWEKWEELQPNGGQQLNVWQLGLHPGGPTDGESQDQDTCESKEQHVATAQFSGPNQHQLRFLVSSAAAAWYFVIREKSFFEFSAMKFAMQWGSWPAQMQTIREHGKTH